LITIDSVIGNIKKDKKLGEKYDEMCARKVCETIKINRLESQRVRMRKTSDKGTDIALTLPQGTHLRHGDVVMLTEDRIVVVEIEPENVAMVEIKNNIHNNDDDIIEVPVIIGHTIGNLHRPIKLEGNKIYFPIQLDSELEMFKKLLASINEHIEIKKTEMVFEPDEGLSIHEH
jgi:urease accessory protein